jgi:hypothetical protein
MESAAGSGSGWLTVALGAGGNGGAGGDSEECGGEQGQGGPWALDGQGGRWALAGPAVLTRPVVAAWPVVPEPADQPAE